MAYKTTPINIVLPLPSLSLCFTVGSWADTKHDEIQSFIKVAILVKHDMVFLL